MKLPKNRLMDIYSALWSGAIPLFSLLYLSVGTPAQAQVGLTARYCTEISENDKYTSDGHELSDAGTIIQQNRANYHVHGTGGSYDEYEDVFGETSLRHRIPEMLNAGNIAPWLAAEIVDGHPQICVDIYGLEWIEVSSGGAHVALAQEPVHGANDGFAFEGEWDCEVATMFFSSKIYSNGWEEYGIEEIQEGTDGSYTLFMADGSYITLGDFYKGTMTWLSGQTGDAFTCSALN